MCDASSRGRELKYVLAAIIRLHRDASSRGRELKYGKYIGVFAVEKTPPHGGEN